MELFPALPEDLSALDADALEAYIAEAVEAIGAVRADPVSFVNEDRSSTELLAEMAVAVESLATARAALAALEVEEPAEVEEPEDEPEAEATVVEGAELEAEVAALAALTDEPDPELEVEVTEVLPEEPIVAAAPAAPRPLPRPARARAAAPQDSPAEQAVALTAAAPGLGFDPGSELNAEAVAEMMIRRRTHFGIIPDGTSGEQVPIARASWAHLYSDDRKLDGDVLRNQELIDAVTSPAAIRAEFDKRRKNALVASGGLCAPVTPYYGLQMLSVADRPVRSALPGFNADRGGINYARPTTLGQITTAVGVITAAQDKSGGSPGTKTCQTVICPSFQETDVEAIFHCVKFGNLGARTFPENVAHMNSLVLAAHARTAESGLLTHIDAFSTAVTAGDLGLGASSALLGQILAAVNGMRNRHRMNTEAVLRILLPDWTVDLLVSDVIRGQFARFDTDEDKLVAFLRTLDVEPSFYMDGAAGASQVFGAQGAGALLSFPHTCRWYLYPEGSFLYLDGGTLELGLVRDSVLNATNDYQIFGETFENVAYVGIESLAVTSSIQDTGAVSATHTVTDPISY